MKKYLSNPQNRQTIVLSAVLALSLALVAGTVFAATTFSSNTITSDGGITITPAGGQAVTVNGNFTVTGTCSGCGSGSTTPAGSNTQVQFNDGGAFGANSGLTYNKSTNALTATGAITGSNFTGSSSGTNTGDQTITLTGDVTGSGTGSFAATIGAGRVTLADMANLATTHLIGRSTAGTGVPEAIAIGSGLSLSGGTLAATGGGSFNGLLGNNSPSLSSPKNAVLAINQDYSGALGSNQDDGATLSTIWAPSGVASGQSDSLLIDGTLQGSQNLTGDMYGLHVHQEDQSSATVSKIEGIRTEASITTGSGTLSTLYGVAAVVHADHGTATDAHDFNAYSPEVGTSGAITRGVEYFGSDPLGSGCTSCLSQYMDFGSAGNMIIAPTLAAAVAYGAASNLVQINSNLNNAQLGTGGGNILDAVGTFTPTTNYSTSAFYTASNGAFVINPAHDISNVAWNGVNGEVSVNAGTGNLTAHTGNPSIAGVNGEWDYYSSGTADAADAIETFVGSGGGGVITNGTSIHINAPYDTTTAVTNYDGLLIDDQTWPGSTTNYAIKYNGPSSNNFIVNADGTVAMGPALSTLTSLAQGIVFGGQQALITEKTARSGLIVVNDNNLAQGPIGTESYAVFSPAADSSHSPIGVDAEAYVGGTHSLTSSFPAIGLYAYAENDSSGTINSLAGIYIDSNSSSTGTVLHNYGILIQDQSGPSTDGWALQYNGPIGVTGITAGGAQVDTPGTFTIADNGNGSTAAAATLTPTTTEVKITCNDAQGCNVTMGETGIQDGQVVKMINVGTNTVNFADTSGVSELAGAFAAGQWDALTLQYVTDRWVEMSRSNN